MQKYARFFYNIPITAEDSSIECARSDVVSYVSFYVKKKKRASNLHNNPS